MTLTKRCTKCGKEYPATSEWFHRNCSRKDGLHVYCKECNRDHVKQWQQVPENREHKLEYQRQWYQNPEVQERKREYHRQRQQDPEYRECRREYQCQYRQNPEVQERKREYHRQRYQDPEVREHQREYCRQRYQDPEYQERHREYQRQRYQDPEVRERIREYKRQWYQDPEGKAIIKAAAHRRRARERQLPDTLTAAEIQRMRDYWQGKCAVCGKSEGLWHIIACDHFIAVSDPRPDNPGTVAANIIPLCHSKEGVPAGTPCCNQSKADKDPLDWLTELYGTRKARAIIRRIEAYFEWVREQDRKAA